VSGPPLRVKSRFCLDRYCVAYSRTGSGIVLSKERDGNQGVLKRGGLGSMCGEKFLLSSSVIVQSCATSPMIYLSFILSLSVDLLYWFHETMMHSPNMSPNIVLSVTAIDRMEAPIEGTEIHSRGCEVMTRLEMAIKVPALWESLAAVSALMCLETWIVSFGMAAIRVSNGTSNKESGQSDLSSPFVRKPLSQRGH
jgi:hypothetical protein